MTNAGKRVPSTAELLIRPYLNSDQAQVVALWQTCLLTRPWNDPYRDIARKLTVQPESFLVGLTQNKLVASVMAGFDGHRGWINYLAVNPDYQNSHYGLAMMTAAEDRLKAMGCPKVNLQVRSANQDVIAFYQSIGYCTDDVVSLGKRLVPDN